MMPTTATWDRATATAWAVLRAATRNLRRVRLLRVDKLVAQSVLGAVLLTWLMLVGLDAFKIFISEAYNVDANYTLTKAVVYVLLTIPRRCYEMFGYAALIGGLLGLGGLAGTSELTALRAAGLSKLRICASVALALLMLTLVVTIEGETLGPYGERKAQALQLAAKSKDITLAKGGSLWARDGETVINARRATSQATPQGNAIELFGVRIFEFAEDGRLTFLTLAESAIHVGSGWTLHNLRRTAFAEASATTTKSAQLPWSSGLDPGLLELSIINPQYMAIADLGRSIAYMHRNQQDASTYVQAYWGRIFYPLSVLVLAFCAMPFAFGTLRSGGLARRLFVGMIIAIGFYFLQKAIVSLATVYGVHPALANLFAPLLLMAGVTVYFRRNA
ncbi:MAG: LPS export ABC transporter permease LptG [Dokdonella sp.]